jgi:hypothetical protein
VTVHNSINNKVGKASVGEQGHGQERRT